MYFCRGILGWRRAEGGEDMCLQLYIVRETGVQAAWHCTAACTACTATPLTLPPPFLSSHLFACVPCILSPSSPLWEDRNRQTDRQTGGGSGRDLAKDRRKDFPQWRTQTAHLSSQTAAAAGLTAVAFPILPLAPHCTPPTTACTRSKAHLCLLTTFLMHSSTSGN